MHCCLRIRARGFYVFANANSPITEITYLRIRKRRIAMEQRDLPKNSFKYYAFERANTSADRWPFVHFNKINLHHHSIAKLGRTINKNDS